MNADFIDGEIVLTMNNQTAVVGTYNLVAAFVHPAIRKFSLGLKLIVTATDVCNFTTISTGGTYQKMIYTT